MKRLRKKGKYKQTQMLPSHMHNITSSKTRSKISAYKEA